MGRPEGWSWNSNTLATWGEELTLGKDPDAGTDWRREEKGTTEDEMVGWHHWLSGHEFEETPGDGGGQRSLACHSPWGCRVTHNWATEHDIQIAARKRFSVFPMENFSSESELNQASKGPLKVHQGFHYFQLGWFFSAFSCIQNTECHQWIRSLFSRTINSMLLSNYIPRSFSSVKSLILGCLFHLKILCIHNVNMMAQVNNEFYWKESFVVFYWNAEGLQGGASGKEPTCQCRRLERRGSIPEMGRSPGGGHGSLL